MKKNKISTWFDIVFYWNFLYLILNRRKKCQIYWHKLNFSFHNNWSKMNLLAFSLYQHVYIKDQRFINAEEKHVKFCFLFVTIVCTKMLERKGSDYLKIFWWHELLRYNFILTKELNWFSKYFRLLRRYV